MSQKIIRYINDGTYTISDLLDTNIYDLTANQMLFFNGSYWQNIDIKNINPLIQNFKVVSDTFIAERFTTYIVSVSKSGIVCYLPANPQVGDYVEIIDKYAAIGGIGCDYGFTTYNVKVEGAPNFYIEESSYYFLTENGEYCKFVYIGCQTWRIIKTGGGGSGAGIDGPYVRTVNDFYGDVKLNAGHIPETVSRLYFNTTRFAEAADSLSLDVFGDVSYDILPNNNNVLSWDSSIGKWVPRSVLLNVYLDALQDVVVQYHVDLGHPVSRGFTTTQPVPAEAYNVTIRTPDTQVFNEETGQYDQVPGEDTGLILYRRDWVLGRQDNDLSWRVQNSRYLSERRLLAHLQDVEIDLNDPANSYATINIGHGQVLQWDGTIHRWKPGAVVNLNSTDDLPEGNTNLYLTINSLRSISNAGNGNTSGLTLGWLAQVDDSLRYMTALTHPTSKVLGWVPANQRWEAVNALTDSATTANIDEAVFQPTGTPGGIPWDKHPVNRGYFTGLRVQQTLQYWGELDWIKEVDYVYGRAHGMGLVWDSNLSKWIAGYPVTATTTDDLPEGANNLYYLDERVNTWAESVIQPTVRYFDDVTYNAPKSGQALVWDPEAGIGGSWVNGFTSLMPLSQGEIIVGGTSSFDFIALPPGSQGQYLRINYTKKGYIEWSEPDQTIHSSLSYPDLPQSIFIRARDLGDTILYLGTADGTLSPDEFINPITTNKINIYLEASGIPLPHLTDRVFYNNTPSTSEGVSNDPLALFTSITSNLIIAFPNSQAYRAERILIQAKVSGKQLFNVAVSNDALNWDILQDKGEDYVFEISEDMYLNQNIGINSEIIENDTSFELADFFLISLPFLTQTFDSANTDDLSSLFYRYIKLIPTLPINEGVVRLYEISLYGWINNNNAIHILENADKDSVLATGINNLEYLLPGSDLQIAEQNIPIGFTCWIMSSPAHTAKIYTSNFGRVYSGADNDYPTSSAPIYLPPNNVAQISYIGKQTIYNSNNQRINIHRWHCINITGGGGSGGSEGIDTLYVTNRENHYGTQDASTITGLATVATTGDWADLSNTPTIFNGDYNNLSNKPTLGTAASEDVGTNAFNIVQLDDTGKIPISVLDLDLIGGGGGSFNSPAENKGDLIVHNGTNEVAFPVGTNGFVLKADSTTPTGLKWDTVESLGTNAITLNGQLDTYYLDRANHTGEIAVGAIAGLATVASTGKYRDLIDRPVLGDAASASIGLLSGNVLALDEDNKLPALDGSNLYNINSPLTTLGDLIVRGNGVDSRLGRGTNGQILSVVPVDGTNPLGVAWTDPALDISITHLNDQPASYYLDFANHTGNIDFTNPEITTTGLAAIATTGDWADLSNKPNYLDTFNGSYNTLSGRPTLGTASQYNVGDSPLNIVQLDNTGKIPNKLIDANFNFISPITTKGDIMVRGVLEDERLPVGTDNQILLVDSTTNLGVKWANVEDLSVSPELPLTSKGDLLVHNGSILVPLPAGNDNNFLIADSSSPSGLKWSSTVANAKNIVGVESAGVNKYYGTNNIGEVGFHTYTTGIGSPLTTKGDIYVFGATNARLPIGTNNQILSVDISTSTGLKWTTIDWNNLNASTLDNKQPSYYLNRANHTGTQLLSTISDAGTAASKNSGKLAGEVLLLSEDNKLPSLDGSLLINLPIPLSPLTTAGDIYIRGSSEDTRLPLGEDGQILMVDTTNANGMIWVDFSPNTGNASTLDNKQPSYYLNRANHTGTQLLSTISDAGTAASKNSGTLAGEVLLLSEDNKLPALDGSLLTGIQSSFIATVLNSTTTLTAVTNRLILIDSSTASFNITLPTNPTSGDKIIFVDYHGSDPAAPSGLGLNLINIYPSSGHTIQGFSELTLDEENTSVGLVFNSNKWVIYFSSI